MSTTYGITWTGVDGSTWDLLNGTTVRLAKGYSGLHLPSFTQVTSKASRIPGQRYLGTTYNARDVILPIIVYGAQGDSWRAADDAWWQSLSPEDTGTLTVTTDAGSRSLDCRLGAASDPALDMYPGRQGVGQYALTLEADQPFWTGPDIVQSYQLPATDTSQNYYGGSGGGGVGPPFYITAGSVLTQATISNPGDRPAYARLTFTGPGQPTFTIAGGTTTLPQLVAGQSISIDTNPTASSAVLDVTGGGASNFWPLMGAHDFWHAIPAGAVGYPIPLVFSGGVYAQSTVTVTVTPLYNRAW